MKAMKFFNIFIPALAGTAIVAAPLGLHIANGGIFRFNVKVNSLNDAVEITNSSAAVGHDFLTGINFDETLYDLDSFTIKVGDKALPVNAYAYSPDRKQLIIYGKYITSQNVSIVVNVIEKTKTDAFENDTWENIVRYSANFEQMQQYYGRTSFIGLERKVHLNVNGTTLEYRVRVVGQQEDYTNYDTKTRKFSNPVALTYEFVNLISSGLATNPRAIPQVYGKSGETAAAWENSTIRPSVRKIMEAGLSGLSGEYQDDKNILKGVKNVVKLTNMGNGDNGGKKDNAIKAMFPVPTQDTFFIPSLWEYYSAYAIERTQQSQIQWYSDLNAAREIPQQYSYYRQTVANADPFVACQYVQKTAVPGTSGEVSVPPGYWLRTPIDDKNGAFAIYGGNHERINYVYSSNRNETFGIAPLFCI